MNEQTAKLSAIRMALKLIRRLKQKSFVVYSDALSSLQAIQSFDIINIIVFDNITIPTIAANALILCMHFRD